MLLTLVVVMNWDIDSNLCTADTYGHHFLHGTRATAQRPDECLLGLVEAWRKMDKVQETLTAIDNEIDP
jgi:hypothetical protein